MFTRGDTLPLGVAAWRCARGSGRGAHAPTEDYSWFSLEPHAVWPRGSRGGQSGKAHRTAHVPCLSLQTYPGSLVISGEGAEELIGGGDHFVDGAVVAVDHPVGGPVRAGRPAERGRDGGEVPVVLHEDGRTVTAESLRTSVATRPSGAGGRCDRGRLAGSPSFRENGRFLGKPEKCIGTCDN